MLRQIEALDEPYMEIAMHRRVRILQNGGTDACLSCTDPQFAIADRAPTSSLTPSLGAAKVTTFGSETSNQPEQALMDLLWQPTLLGL